MLTYRLVDLLASPGNIESTSPIERLIRRPKVLKAALKYIPDLSSANGPMNALLRNPKHTTGQGWKNMRKAQIDRWLDSSGTVLLDAGVSMEGIEGHVKRYKDRLRAQQGGIGSSEVTDEDLEDVQSMMVLFGEVV